MNTRQLPCPTGATVQHWTGYAAGTPSRTEDEVTYLAYAIGAAWLCGMLFLAGRVINALRLTLNNLAPGADYWAPEYEAFRKGYYFHRLDPVLFNENGQKHLKELNHHSLIFNVWLIIGAALIILATVYFGSR